MKKPLSIGSLLLITTALVAPPTLAQVETGAASAPSTPAPAEDKVDVSIPGASGDSDIIVTGRFIPEPIRATAEVVAVLSTADIARSGDGDIAGALQRGTGLSVAGNGFVYVRGLGDRYSLALLNGSPLPSPEPLRRVVPLEIFPTSVLASALVQKSYSPNYPGEFGGGVINLTTSAIPTRPFLSFGASISGDGETTGKLGYSHYGSDTDWTGFDDGARAIPGPLKQALGVGSAVGVSGDFTLAEVQAITASLLNAPTTLLQRNRDIPANFSTDLSGGTAIDIGSSRLGILASFGYSNNWKTRDARQQNAIGLDSINEDFRSVRTENRIVVNGLLGLGLEFDDHKLRWTNLFIRDTQKLSRLAAGFSINGVGDPVPGEPPQLLKQNTSWYERQLLNTQLVSEFRFGDFSVDLRGSYANSKREAPYERDFTYRYSSQIGDYFNALGTQGTSASVAFSELNEDLYSGGIDLSYKLPTENEMKLSAGYAYSSTKRDSFRRVFFHRPSGGSIPLAVQQQRPDYLLSDYNVYSYGIVLSEEGSNQGQAAYDAELTVHGAYAQLEAEIVPMLRASAGVRYEDGEQSVSTIDIFSEGLVQRPALKENYWLPAATLTWNFAEDMQLRLNASKTIARPQFRELAPQFYQDTESDRQFVGNPFLVDSELINAEARYEYYFDRGQRFTLSGFYKQIDNPIEAVASFVASTQLVTTFANAPKAELYGAEVEVTKYFPLADAFGGEFWLNRRLVTIANYTYSKSKIKVKASDLTILNDTRGERSAMEVFSDGDPLTGQSDHLANLQIGLEDTERLSQQTFLITYASKRVTNRGPRVGGVKQPDIVEKPGFRLDFVMREEMDFLGRTVELKFEARNITGTKFSEFQQGPNIRVINNEYDVGTSLSLGLGVKF